MTLSSLEPRGWGRGPIAIVVQFAAAAILWAGLLLLVATQSTFHQLNLILYFIAGAVTMAALSSLASLFRRDSPAPEPQRNVRVTFNTAIVTQGIDEGLRDEVGRGTPILVPVREPEELSPRALIGKDNSLALAYLRLEIERALRHVLLATNNGWAGSSNASVTRLTEVLMQAGAIHETWRAPIMEVTRAANSAVHGAEVSDTIALAVIDSGENIIAYLESMAKQRSQPKGGCSP